MKKMFFLFSMMFLLNGCIESVALLGSSIGGASSGKMLQSSIQQSVSYGIKKQTGKTPLGHVLAYAEKNNPENKKETCISFIEKTRSKFCTIANKKISLTNRVIKEKLASNVKVKPKINNLVSIDRVIEPKTNADTKNLNFVNSFNRLKKSPRQLAIILQSELKKLKDSHVK